MKQTIQNLARRPIALHCNSGETLHLPPGYVHEIPEEEIKNNALAAKLQRQKLLSVEPAKTEGKQKVKKPVKKTDP